MQEAESAGRVAPLSAGEEATQRPFQLVKYYSVTSLVIILLFGLLISTVVSRRAAELVRTKTEQYALLMAENLNHQVMTRYIVPVIKEKGKIELRHPDQFRLLDAVVKNTIHSYKVSQVNILDLEGSIVYSTRPHYIARTGYGGPHFQKAAAGGLVSVLEPPSQFFELGPSQEKRLRTLIPLRDERRLTAEMGPPRAVFELILDVSQDFREVWLNQMFIVATLGLMMALLFVILRSIVLRGQRIMARQAAREKALEDQLNQNERLASLGRMIAGVAHEIRNPLGIIRSTAELLGRRADKSAGALTGVIVEESTRLNNIVTEFMDFARPARAELVPTRLEDVLEKNLVALAAPAEKAGVKVTRRYNSGQAKALADGNLLYRVFLNILNNALQAMEEEGGVLTVSTQAMKNRGNGELALVVEDTGPGFDDQALSAGFDPFYTTKEQGTGLGLSIVKSIVDTHHGRVEIGRAEGGGAKVTVWLPLAAES